MRPTMAIPLIMLAGAGTATMRVQDLTGAAAKPVAEPTRLAASIEDDLAKRQAKLDQRARALDLQERVIAATKGRVAPAASTPGAAAATPSAAPGQAQKPTVADEKILQLARVYQAMKPREAAAVFEQLAMPLQVKIAEQMRERSVAAVMAAMSPPAASALTAALAGVALPAPAMCAGRPLPAPAPAPSSPAPAGRSLPADGTRGG